jgi:hypothetical protein
MGWVNQLDERSIDYVKRRKNSEVGNCQDQQKGS